MSTRTLTEADASALRTVATDDLLSQAWHEVAEVLAPVDDLDTRQDALVIAARILANDSADALTPRIVAAQALQTARKRHDDTLPALPVDLTDTEVADRLQICGTRLPVPGEVTERERLTDITEAALSTLPEHIGEAARAWSDRPADRRGRPQSIARVWANQNGEGRRSAATRRVAASVERWADDMRQARAALLSDPHKRVGAAEARTPTKGTTRPVPTDAGTYLPATTAHRAQVTPEGWGLWPEVPRYVPAGLVAASLLAARADRATAPGPWTPAPADPRPVRWTPEVIRRQDDRRSMERANRAHENDQRQTTAPRNSLIVARRLVDTGVPGTEVERVTVTDSTGQVLSTMHVAPATADEIARAVTRLTRTESTNDRRDPAQAWREHVLASEVQTQHAPRQRSRSRTPVTGMSGSGLDRRRLA